MVFRVGYGIRLYRRSLIIASLFYLFSALDPNVSLIGTDTSSSLILPTSLQYTALHVQFLCIQELFELHLDLDKSQFTNGTFPVKPYDFYVPPKNEIGISSLGESQFHVFVNLTGTTFSFGMIAAELSGKTRGRRGDQLYTHLAFSFLPDNKDNKLRLRQIYRTKYESHYDVIVKDPAIYKHGGILSLLAACPVSNSVIRRMDMKQTIHLHPRSRSVLPLYFMALADIGMEPRLTVDKSGKAFLRCKTIGNPTPSLTLVKQTDTINQKSTEVRVPSYDITLPFEVTKTFQFFNVTNIDFGQYACKAENGQHILYGEYILSGL